MHFLGDVFVRVVQGLSESERQFFFFLFVEIIYLILKL